MRANSLTIEVLGTSLSISAEEDVEYLQNLLERYRTALDQTQEQTGLRDPLKVAVLAGFLLTEELFKAEQAACSYKAFDEESQEAEKLAQNIISRLDKVLGKKVK
ncbi:cell division protein ZapA [Breznakiellaceae bacterium SP9]